MKRRLHYIASDLQEPAEKPNGDAWPRWFVVSALAVRAGLEEKLRKHALAADVFDELYPEGS